MRSFLAGLRIQLWLLRRQPDDFLMLCTVPFMAIIYLSVVQHANRPDLLPNALLAPVLIGLWMFSVNLVSSIMESERWQGTLEPVVASPAHLQAIFLGRICTITGCGLLPLAETWLLARMVFGITPSVPHPGLFVAAMLVTSAATAATCSALAALFVLSRNSTIYTNFLTYPVYILSGLLVPVAYLPGLVQPFSRLTFLFWSSELMRDTLRSGPVPDPLGRLMIIAAFGIGTGVIGAALMAAVLRRTRELGTLSYA